jgi:hypothetical protein
MTTPPELEDRLRAGFLAAADVLPPAPATLPTPGEDVVRLRPSTPPAPRRRWALGAVATAASLAAVAGAAVVLTGGDGADDNPSEVATASSAPATSGPHELRTINGMVPGQATTDSDGDALHVFGPDGHETGTVDLGAMTDTQAAASDLEGGWVVCGMVEMPAGGDPEGPGDPVAGTAPTSSVPAGTAPTSSVPAGTVPTSSVPAGTAPTSSVPVGPDGASPSDPTAEATTEFNAAGWDDQLTWYPAEGEPHELEIDGHAPICSENSVQVVDSADGPLALIGGLSIGGPEAGAAQLHGLVLATGEVREVPVPAFAGQVTQWSATTGRVLAYIEGVGLQMFDLDSGEALPIAAIDPGDISDMALAHDGKSVAVMTGSTDGPDEAVVYDLATGAETFRRSFDQSTEGDSMTYDGTTLAVGSYYHEHGPLTVIDLATGTEHTVAAGGVVL